MAISCVHALTLHLQFYKLGDKHITINLLPHNSATRVKLGFFLYQTYKIKQLSFRTLKFTLIFLWISLKNSSVAVFYLKYFSKVFS